MYITWPLWQCARTQGQRSILHNSKMNTNIHVLSGLEYCEAIYIAGFFFSKQNAKPRSLVQCTNTKACEHAWQSFSLTKT